MRLLEKFLSKKFFVCTGSLITMFFNVDFDVEGTWKSLAPICSMISIYLVGQSYVDGKKEAK